MNAKRWIDVSVAVVWLGAAAATGVATVRSVCADGTSRIFAERPRKRESFADAVRTDLLGHLWLLDRHLDLNGGWNRLLGRRRCNNVYRLENGHLSRPTTPLDTAESAARMDAFSRFCGDLGIRTLFVQCPYKVDPGQTVVPRGVPFDWANRNADSFLSGLRGTETLDLRPLLAGSAEDVTRNFFRTDHHWTFKAAFAASGAIARRVLDLLGEPAGGADALDASKWETRAAPRTFTGAVGRRTGPWFGGTDAVEYPVPAFRTDLFCSSTRRRGDMEIRSGPFDEAVLRREVLAEPESRYKDTAYSLYGADRGMVRFENRSAPVRRRVFVVKDSYGTPVVAFLSSVFSEVVAFDLRHWKSLSVEDVVSVCRPDAVLVLYNPRDLAAKPYFSFRAADGGAPPDRTVLLRLDRAVPERAEGGAARLELGGGRIRPGDRLCLTVGSAAGAGAWAAAALVDAATGETVRRDGVACGVATPQNLLFFVPDRPGDWRLELRAVPDGTGAGRDVRFDGVSLERVGR